MRNKQFACLILNLPQRIVDEIDEKSIMLSLKRGPTTRIYLMKALEKYQSNISDVFQEMKIPGEECLPVSLQITENVNERLEEICKLLPVSKKKIAEIFVMKAVKDELA